MSQYTVSRQREDEHCIIGAFGIEGVFFCYTLEPPRKPDPAGNGFICIPAGTYHAVVAESFHFSQLFGRSINVPKLQNVPGRSNIEIHPGNVPRQTDGCTMVGYGRTADAITQSDDAFFALMSKLPQEFDITYEDPVQQLV